MNKVNAIRSIKKAKNETGISPLKAPNNHSKDVNPFLKQNGWNSNVPAPNYYQRAIDANSQPRTNNFSTKKNSAFSKPKLQNINRPLEEEQTNQEVRRVQSSNFKRKVEEKTAFQDEEYQVLKQYWNDLGVTDDFRNYFEIYAAEFQPKDRREYFLFEINSLKKIHENLTVIIK